ncbi:MAG: phosphatidate cytidylyltransferase [Candidatus Dormibacteraceae bacterium]
MGNFVVRVASGLLILFISMGLIFSGEVGVVILCVIIAGFCLWEFRGLSDKMGYRSPSWLLYPLGAFITFSGTYLRFIDLKLVLSIALIGGLMAFLFIPGRREGLGRWAMGVAGAIYIGIPMNCYLLLYQSKPHGLYWLVLPVLAAAATDTFALLVGSRVGRHPFFAWISPKKTVEGAVGGLAGAMAVMTTGSILLLGLPWWHAVVLGLLVGVGAELGDLVESQMKRIAEVKDSSNLIPGHGGVLDRFDSILFPSILVYYYALALGLIH